MHRTAPSRFPSRATPLRPSRFERSAAALSAAEWGLLIWGAVLLGVAALAPAWQQPAAYHAFADQRTLAGLPHALDVLSNVPFVLVGLLGLVVLRAAAPVLSAAERILGACLAVGLLLTGLWSSLYHLRPQDVSLVFDRLGMGVAFAGLLGWAVADRVSARAGLVAAAAVLGGTLVSLVVWRATGNLWPWAVLQAGGLLSVLCLSGAPVADDGRRLPLLAVVLMYGLAKLLELGDHAVFEATGNLVSGHTLKHGVAALAVLPVWWSLVGAGRSTGQGTIQSHHKSGRAQRA